MSTITHEDVLPCTVPGFSSLQTASASSCNVHDMRSLDVDSFTNFRNLAVMGVVALEYADKIDVFLVV